VKIFGPFTMGTGVQIGSNSFIGAGPGGLTIGDHVLISPNCTILTTSYHYDRLGVPLQAQSISSQGVRIGHRVWVGANSVILDGTVLGDDVIVAAGSIVSGRIPDRSIVQGNPAKVVFTRR
jgi:acetyltransferase-like isoleucine patch superfamily enzyme